MHLSLLLSLSAAAGQLLPVDVPEPSGIDHDPRSGRTFVVDDGGELWVFDADFEVLDVFHLGGDLEGVDYLPGPDQLLVAVEGDEQLLRVDPDTGAVEAALDIPRTFRGKLVMAEGGNGIESLVVVGRRIFVTNQAFDVFDEDDGSILVELRMRADETLQIAGIWRLPFPDAAGALFSAPTQELFLSSDYNDRVYRLKLDALDHLNNLAWIPEEDLRSFWIPGVDQEGICLVDGDLLIAQDSGDLYDAGRLRWLMSDAGQLSVTAEWGD